MGLMITYAIVLLLGAVPFIEAIITIPLGAVAGLNVGIVAILSLIGNVITLLLAIALAGKLRSWWARRREEKGAADKRGKRGANLWKKYGLPGLAIIGPMVIGSTHVTAMLAMSFGAGKRATTLWMLGSLFGWSLILGVLSFYGADFLHTVRGSQGFLVDLLERYN